MYDLYGFATKVSFSSSWTTKPRLYEDREKRDAHMKVYTFHRPFTVKTND